MVLYIHYGNIYTGALVISLYIAVVNATMMINYVTYIFISSEVIRMIIDLVFAFCVFAVL
jgi:flagellar biosynthesis protein FliQ